MIQDPKPYGDAYLQQIAGDQDEYLVTQEAEEPSSEIEAAKGDLT